MKSQLLPNLPAAIYVHLGNGGVFHTAWAHEPVEKTDCGKKLKGVYWTKAEPRMVSGLPSMTIRTVCRSCVKSHNILLDILRAETAAAVAHQRR